MTLRVGRASRSRRRRRRRRNADDASDDSGPVPADEAIRRAGLVRNPGRVSDNEQCSIPITADGCRGAGFALAPWQISCSADAGVRQGARGVQPCVPFAHPMTDGGRAIAARPDAEIPDE